MQNFTKARLTAQGKRLKEIAAGRVSGCKEKKDITHSHVEA